MELGILVFIFIFALSSGDDRTLGQSTTLSESTKLACAVRKKTFSQNPDTSSPICPSTLYCHTISSFSDYPQLHRRELFLSAISRWSSSQSLLPDHTTLSNFAQELSSYPIADESREFPSVYSQCNPSLSEGQSAELFEEYSDSPFSHLHLTNWEATAQASAEITRADSSSRLIKVSNAQAKGFSTSFEADIAWAPAIQVLVDINRAERSSIPIQVSSAQTEGFATLLEADIAYIEPHISSLRSLAIDLDIFVTEAQQALITGDEKEISFADRVKALYTILQKIHLHLFKARSSIATISRTDPVLSCDGIILSLNILQTELDRILDNWGPPLPNPIIYLRVLVEPLEDLLSLFDPLKCLPF